MDDVMLVLLTFSVIFGVWFIILSTKVLLKMHLGFSEKQATLWAYSFVLIPIIALVLMAVAERNPDLGPPLVGCLVAYALFATVAIYHMFKSMDEMVPKPKQYLPAGIEELWVVGRIRRFLRERTHS